MKRFTIIALAVLVAFSCLISCSNESASVESQLVSVSFTASQSRSLQEIKPGFVGVRDDSIEWYYKATKAPGSDFLTGQATEWTIIPANTSTTDSVAGKLDNQITFSLGKWDFYLQARLRSNHTTVVYEGFKLGVLLSDARNVSKIDIDVSPIIEGQNGYLRLEEVYIKDISGNNVAPNVFKIGDTNYSFTINEDKTISTNDISLPVGSYTIGVGYTADGAVNAAETKTVQIYSGRTTTVIGFVDEQTGLVEFNPISDSGIATPVFNEDSTTTFTINNVSPSMMASTDETPIYTSASFPSGSLTGVTAENATLTVNVNSIDSNFSVGATGGSTAIAGLDISLVVNGQPVTQFNNKNVTITTYIAKGLTGVAVKYNGGEVQPGTVTVTTSTGSSTVEGNYYESDTGKLVFSTNHFSEYYVVADRFVAFNKTTNLVYTDLIAAVNDLTSGNTLVLFSDWAFTDKAQLTSEGGLIIDVPCTIEGNDHTLSNNLSVDNHARILSIFDILGGEVVIKNINLESTTYNAWFRGISLANTHDMTVKLEKVNISIPHYYAFNIGSDCQRTNIVMNNCDISGWSTIYNHTSDITLEATGCSFDSTNPTAAGGDSNSFSNVIVAEYYQWNSDGPSANNTMTFNRCEFTAAKQYPEADVSQIVFDIRSPNHNNLYVNGCTFTKLADPNYIEVAIDTLWPSDTTWEQRVDMALSSRVFVDGTDVTETADYIEYFIDTTEVNGYVGTKYTFNPIKFFLNDMTISNDTTSCTIPVGDKQYSIEVEKADDIWTITQFQEVISPKATPKYKINDGALQDFVEGMDISINVGDTISLGILVEDDTLTGTCSLSGYFGVETTSTIGTGEPGVGYGATMSQQFSEVNGSAFFVPMKTQFDSDSGCAKGDKYTLTVTVSVEGYCDQQVLNANVSLN